MKMVGIIPARYKSSRFEGKPLADICGKPMIWYVYEQMKKLECLEEVYVATDDKRIEQTCLEYEIPVIMTSEDNETPLSRIHEVSTKLQAEWYICVNGDEPLIEPEAISKLLEICSKEDNYAVINALTDVEDPVEVIDFTNLKIVTNEKGEGLYISRSPIPYPKGTLDFKYKKYVGITCLKKSALDYYSTAHRSLLETIEDNDLLRFIMGGIKVKFVPVETHTISVDTPKDLERVREKIKIHEDSISERKS